MNNLIWGLLFLSTSFFQCSNASNGCNDDGWTPYSDEKCIKVFQHATTSFDEAEAFCTQQMANGGGGGDEDEDEALKSDSISQVVPRLLTIDNADQQTFVKELLFGNNSIDNLENSNIWLGAKFENDAYFWRRNYGRNGGGVELDQESVRTWQGKTFGGVGGSHLSKETGPCIEMLTKTEGQVNKGEWTAQPCKNRPKSHVVCERPQLWPVAKLQEHLIKLMSKFIRTLRCAPDKEKKEFKCGYQYELIK